jgi:hypothetical protein
MLKVWFATPLINQEIAMVTYVPIETHDNEKLLKLTSLFIFKHLHQTVALMLPFHEATCLTIHPYMSLS